MVRPILMLTIAGGVAVTGCTSNTTTTTSGTSQSLSQQLAEAFCGWQACCGAGGGSAADGGQTSDAGAAAACGASTGDAGLADQCVARVTLAGDQQLALVATAYSEGLVTIDTTIAQSCAAAYQVRSCAGSATLDVDEAVSSPACAGLFTGYIPVGERCDMTAECQAGNYCLSQATGQAITSVQGGGTLGVCFPYQAAGATCNSTGDCLPPLTCDPTLFVCG